MDTLSDAECVDIFIGIYLEAWAPCLWALFFGNPTNRLVSPASDAAVPLLA